MNSCCSSNRTELPPVAAKPRERAKAKCPQCGASGRRVERRTVLHHVRPEHIGGVIEEHYWFCSSRHCPVVYYGENGSIFETHELREPVGQKVTGDGSPACYCFGFTEGHIRKDISTTGKSSIPQIITELVKSGNVRLRDPESGRIMLPGTNTRNGQAPAGGTKQHFSNQPGV